MSKSGFMAKMTRWLLGKKRSILISIINVVVLMLLSYVLNNQSLFTGENLFQYSWVEYFKDAFGITQSRTNNDVVFVNVGYDKKLIEKNDEFGFQLGNVTITDRKKIAQILQKLNNIDTYSYIFLDVVFEKGYEDIEADSLLLEEIKRTKRIVIATHPDIELMDGSLQSVAAWNNYDATIIDSNFSRYLYLEKGKPSMPLFAYNSLTGRTISKKAFLYFSNGKLCYNSLFVRFPIVGTEEYGKDDVKQYYNLGNDILENYSDADLALLCDGKYVFIGDMVEDMHDTYAGSETGPAITYYAFKELMEGRHIVNYLLSVFLAILYFLISMSLFSEKAWLDKMSLAIFNRYKLLRFLMSFIGYMVVLTLCAILLGVLFDTYISILLPSLYFTIQKTITDYKRMKI